MFGTRLYMTHSSELLIKELMITLALLFNVLQVLITGYPEGAAIDCLFGELLKESERLVELGKILFNPHVFIDVLDDVLLPFC